MTQEQNHRRPLAPGEMRTHTVGVQDFLVMHVAGGSMAQASTWSPGGTSLVLSTSMNIQAAVDAYADAIEQAESDRADALDDADGVAFIGAASGELIEPDAQVDYNLPMGADPALVYGETPAEIRTGTSDRVAAALNELAALRMLLTRTRMGGDRRSDLLEILDGATALLKESP